MDKETIEKMRIIRISRRKKQRGEVALDRKWMEFLVRLCDEMYRKAEKKEAEEKEKTLDSFIFNGKKFYFYNPNKKVRS